MKALLGAGRTPSLRRRAERPATALQKGIVLRDERDPAKGNY